MDLFACLVNQHSNLREKIRECSILEPTKNLSASIQTLIEEFKTAGFEKKVGISINLITLALLTLLVSQVSNSDADNKIHDIWKRTVTLK